MNENSNQQTCSTSLVPTENYLFMGNPGTGKSTLINCLVGSAIFNAGLSYGGGLTQKFQARTFENIQYMDTPGLADRHIQEVAAVAITEALQQSGTYKLFFMVRLENGRVVSDDLATIEIVLSSIDIEEIPFAVIINNVKKRQYTKMMEKGADYLKVVTLINSITRTTHHITFIPVIDDLDEEDNAVTELPGEVKNFIQFKCPTVDISPNVVKPIKIEDFKKMSENLRGAQEQLLNDNALLEHRIAELTGTSNSFWHRMTNWWDSCRSTINCTTPSETQGSDDLNAVKSNGANGLQKGGHRESQSNEKNVVQAFADTETTSVSSQIQESNATEMVAETSIFLDSVLTKHQTDNTTKVDEEKFPVVDNMNQHTECEGKVPEYQDTVPNGSSPTPEAYMKKHR